MPNERKIVLAHDIPKNSVFFPIFQIAKKSVLVAAVTLAEMAKALAFFGIGSHIILMGAQFAQEGQLCKTPAALEMSTVGRTLVAAADLVKL